MDKLLPVIEVQKPEPQITNTPDNRLPENASGMDLMSAVISDCENKEDIEDDIITIEERDIPDEDDVFGDAPPPRVKPLASDKQEVVEQEQPTEFPEKKGKRKYTRKAPMSDKQKEHLARIRKIAIEKRKAEKERKIKEKEEAVIEKAEKKILADKEKKLKKEKEEQEVINSQLKKEPIIQQNGFTKEDLDNAVLSAISQYDTLRKQQKKEKREAQAKEREQAKMRETLARAIQPPQPTNDPWRGFFT